MRLLRCRQDDRIASSLSAFAGSPPISTASTVPAHQLAFASDVETVPAPVSTQAFQACAHVFPSFARPLRLAPPHHLPVSIVQARLSAFHPQPLPGIDGCEAVRRPWRASWPPFRLEPAHLRGGPGHQPVHVSIVQARLSPFSRADHCATSLPARVFQSCKHVFPPLAGISPMTWNRIVNGIPVFQSCKHVFRPFTRNPYQALTDVQHRGKTPARGVSTSPLLMQGNTM